MWLRLASLLPVTLALGCGQSEIGPTYPVRGTLRLNGTPLTAKSTTILFKPDVSRGNNSTYVPSGTVDDAGRYRLTTRGVAGAPPGWYKVIVTAFSATREHPESTRRRQLQVASLLPPKYGQADTTPLAVEVVANPPPGAYDLKLSK
jgi:hypothetical protein